MRLTISAQQSIFTNLVKISEGVNGEAILYQNAKPLEPFSDGVFGWDYLVKVADVIQYVLPSVICWLPKVALGYENFDWPVAPEAISDRLIAVLRLVSL